MGSTHRWRWWREWILSSCSLGRPVGPSRQLQMGALQGHSRLRRQQLQRLRGRRRGQERRRQSRDGSRHRRRLESSGGGNACLPCVCVRADFNL